MTDPRRTSRYQKVRAEVLKYATHCHICGRPFDPRYVGRHRLAKSADHIVPLDAGGDPYDPENLRPAHLGCNSSRGARRRNNSTSRKW